MTHDNLNQRTDSARDRIRAKEDERIALGWDPGASGRWLIALGIAFVLSGVLCLLARFVGIQGAGFFEVLRWLVSASTIAGAIGSLRVPRGRRPTLVDWIGALAFGGIAVLFNPIAPIHLERSSWQPIDLVVGVFLLACSLLMLSVGVMRIGSAGERRASSVSSRD